MGSLFLVVIPIRNFEFQLRLQENNASSLPVTSISVRDGDDQETLLRTVSKSLREETPGVVRIELVDDDGVMAKDITLPAKVDVRQAYTMNQGGSKLLLEVTRDKMKLTHLTKVKETEPKVVVPFSQPVLSDTLTATSITSQGSTGDSFKIENTQLIELIDSHFLEKHMEKALTKFDLLKATWEHSIDEKFSTITFAVKADKTEEVINHLHLVGIGKKYQSSLSVCSSTVYTQEDGMSTAEIEEEKSKWNDFVQSIKARLTVAQVVQNVHAGAVMTFDFIIMIIVAGIIASLGLLEDSSVNLIASMLVSPLMGPIMAFTFGAMIRDVPLIKIGVVSELWGLLICIIVGFVFGLFTEFKPMKGPWDAIMYWPTKEMSSRSQLRSLVIGAGIAIPSGAGVALSILAGNAGSLVGVAISASLLPPCVNCGMFYGMSLALAVQEANKGNNPLSAPCNQNTTVESFRNHSVVYCENAQREYAIMGTISLSLTLLNIALIFLTGLVVLKIKEVAPYTSRKTFERFWKHDLRQARNYNMEHLGEKDALLSGIGGHHTLLNAVQDDFVFNRVRNRVMDPDENIIDKLRRNPERWKSPSQKVAESSKGGWFSGWFSAFGGKHDDVEASRPKMTNRKSKVAVKDGKSS